MWFHTNSRAVQESIKIRLTGSTNVGTHDHVNSLVDGDGSGTDQRDNNRGSGGGGLEEDGGQNTNHQSGNRVDIVTEEFSGRASSHNLGTRSEKIKTKEEEVKEEKNKTNSDENHSPFLSAVVAACLGDLTPSSLGGFFELLELLLLLGWFLLFDISHDEFFY